MSWGSNYQSGSRRGKTNTVINAVIKDWGWRLEEEQARHNTRDESPSGIGCRLAIPGVIVTDHRALESGVWSSPRIVQDNWTTWITDRIKNLHSLSQPPISQANTDQTPKHLWNSHAQYLALKRQFFVWFVILDNSWSVLMTRICRVGEFSSSSPSTICSTSPSLSARNSSPRSNTDTWLRWQKRGNDGNDWKLLQVCFSRVRMFLVSIIAKVGWDHHVQVICLCLYEPHNAVDRWGHPKYPLVWHSVY